jgi:hypothetical protein
MGAGTRRRGAVVTALVALSVAVPMSWAPGRDSFPVSSYPMFSARRDGADVVLVVAGIDAGAGLDVLPTEATGHRHLTQAVRALGQAVADGGDRPARLCAEVAAWVRDHERSDGDVVIATVRYDAIAFLLDDRRTPEIERVHARCGR